MITNEVRIVSESGTVSIYEERGEDFVEVRVFSMEDKEHLTVVFNANEFQRFVMSLYERFI